MARNKPSEAQRRFLACLRQSVVSYKFVDQARAIATANACVRSGWVERIYRREWQAIDNLDGAGFALTEAGYTALAEAEEGALKPPYTSPADQLVEEYHRNLRKEIAEAEALAQRAAEEAQPHG